MSNVDQALRPDRSAASWVSGSAPSLFQIWSMLSSGELSELFDVLGRGAAPPTGCFATVR